MVIEVGKALLRGLITQIDKILGEVFRSGDSAESKMTKLDAEGQGIEARESLACLVGGGCPQMDVWTAAGPIFLNMSS